MKLVTQEGRELELSREYHLFPMCILKCEKAPARLAITTFTKEIRTLSSGMTYETGGDIVERYGVVGEFVTNTGLDAARDLLQAVWENGAEEFTVPQDTFEKSDDEKFNDFCEENHLTLVTINELGYKPSDIPKNLQIWKTTDEFEQRGILVADPTGEYDINAFGGAYSTSLKKWQALQKKSRVLEMPKNIRRGYRQVRGLRGQTA